MATGPEFVGELNEIGEVVGGGGLFDVGVGAEDVGPVDIRLHSGGTEDDGGNDFAFGMSIQPLEYVEAAEARHFEIEQEDVWKWVIFTIGERAFRFQVVNSFLTIADSLKKRADPARAERALNEEAVFLGIVGHQDTKSRFGESTH